MGVEIEAKWNGGFLKYLSVAEMAKKWAVSERSVRNYCAEGRVKGAFLAGKTWNIPENAGKPDRANKRKERQATLLNILQEQKAGKYPGGIFYYRGLKEWNREKGYLLDTCLTAQDRYKSYLDYFRISY